MVVEETPVEWDLSDLYSGVEDPKIALDTARLRERARAFEDRYKGRFLAGGFAPALMEEALDEYEAILRLVVRPAVFANLLFSANAKDDARGALLQKTQLETTSINKHLLFLDLELGAISDVDIARVIDEPSLARYRHYIEYQRLVAKHNLTEAEEKLLDELNNTGRRAFERLFDEVCSRAEFEVKTDNEVRVLTESEVFALLFDPAREVRKAAADAVTQAMKQNSHVLTFIFNNALQHKEIVDRLRGYEYPQQARHEANEVDAKVVQHVVDVVTESFEIVEDYYLLKSRLLGVDKLHIYDRYAPITGTETAIPFAEAKEIVLDAFDSFSPRVRQSVEPFFERRWIDAALRPGKTSGAFCSAVTPELHPYVFMNYTEKSRDVMTLAHELGHGLHDVMASKQHYLDYHPSLPLAETASVFAEILVFERLQQQLDDPGEKLALLCGKIEDTIATVYRQVCMYNFEVSAHMARRAEGELTTERYGVMWDESMQKMFGTALDLGEDHKWWWLYINHIFQMPFYVYAYAFGELMVLSLYARYRAEGEPFVDKYLALLAAGGSKAPADLLREIGIDIHQKSFWQGGIELIRRMVEQAKTLAA